MKMLALCLLVLSVSLAEARPTYAQISTSPHLWWLYGVNEYWRYPSAKERILQLEDCYGSEAAFEKLPRSCFVDPCTWEYSEMDRLMKLGLTTEDPFVSDRIAKNLRELCAVVEEKEKRNKEVQ